MSNNSPVFETKTYDSATKYLADLSPSSPLWYPNSDRWIFRGQRDANWRLVPSAFRSASWQPFLGPIEGPEERGTNKGWILFETHIVVHFARESDRHGLPIPGFDESWLGGEALSQKYNHDIEEEVFRGKQTFPPPNWRSLFCMAQHYGIPTRLLDWSESAKVAAYFAAVEAAEHTESRPCDAEEFIAVWALDIAGVETATIKKSERLISVRAPWSSNPNLRAQKGLFTLHDKPLICDAPPVIEPVEETIERLLDDHRLKRDRPILYCLRLKVNKAGVLLALLHQEGIDAASLFPGYAGVTKSLREEMFRGPINYRDYDSTEN